LGRSAEIISADAMQVYRSMDIGTAKTPPPQRAVPYHCLDLVDPDQDFSAALYQRAARAAIDDCLSRSVLPIVCGGSGLYLRAALDCFELDAQVEAKTQTGQVERRERLSRLADQLGSEAFHTKLAERDPASAALIHPHNLRRVVRAFEFLEEGSSYAAQHQGMREYRSFYPCLYLGLTCERPELYRRIDERVARMFAAGLVDEVKTLRGRYPRLGQSASQAIGYKELLALGPALDYPSASQLDEAAALVARDTRRYAKRQLTWFRRDPRIHWLAAPDLNKLQSEHAQPPTVL
jgi:tRNA dimethylallyltransferase